MVWYCNLLRALQGRHLCSWMPPVVVSTSMSVGLLSASSACCSAVRSLSAVAMAVVASCTHSLAGHGPAAGPVCPAMGAAAADVVGRGICLLGSETLQPVHAFSCASAGRCCTHAAGCAMHAAVVEGAAPTQPAGCMAGAPDACKLQCDASKYWRFVPSLRPCDKSTPCRHESTLTARNSACMASSWAKSCKTKTSGFK